MITALFGVSVLYGTWHFFGDNGLVALCSVVAFIASLEYSMMVEPNSRIVRSLFVCVSYAFFLTFAFLSQSIFVFLSFFIFLASYFVLFTNYSIEQRMTKMASWTVGVMYCGLFTGVVVLATRQFGGPYFLALVLLSFITDTFAYFGGRFMGKRPLAPLISPKKTLEGSFWGLIGGSLGGFLYLNSLEHTSSIATLIITCLAASLFSQVGDLFESMVKRYSGVKDSGKIMPGHGGVLDRIDGLLFTAPFVYLWMTQFT